MGVCLSCLGLRRNDHEEGDRSRLLYDDLGTNHGYGTWGASNVPAQNVMSAEEVQREQEALDNITRWASEYVVSISMRNDTNIEINSQIVEIFPHQHKSLTMSTSQINGHTENGGPSSTHHDILLSLIPGDKSKRSIRIYPASRPTSKDASSLRSKSSFGGLNGMSTNPDPVLVTLDVNMP
ncbi:hypothetical protein EDD37DRAFT_610064 [Exophiala viscosa]|uniref:uncharacterized protein n=1 Tax=Exophiala viscosa TaxID=2486360 RepID=UPI00219C56B0|nr:hypothetical protein EDD37DRAFT_610064 [Exophiala viscosa]